MNKMKTAAKLLDRIMSVLYWIALISTAFILLCTVLFALVSGIPDLLRQSSVAVPLGSLLVTLRPEAVPAGAEKTVLFLSVYQLICMPLYCLILLTIRDALKPFINGEPFHETVAKNLKRLAILLTVHTLLEWLSQRILYRIVTEVYDMTLVFNMENVISFGSKNGASLMPLLFAGALYLLSKVFLYGQELQQLSDETL